jgi:hypothetical protein
VEDDMTAVAIRRVPQRAGAPSRVRPETMPHGTKPRSG